MNADMAETEGGLQLEDRARKLANLYDPAPDTGPDPAPLERLPALRKALRRAYLSFSRISEEQGVLSGVAEWTLDNFYVIQQAIRQIDENMPMSYYRRLPPLADSAEPRVYAVAREIVCHMATQIDIDRVERFIRAYQEVQSLTMGELWALPTMLRLCIVELLMRTVAGVADVELSVDREGLTGCRMLEEKPDEVIVAGAINGLRTIDTHDWDDFFERVSLVEEKLREDPADVYAAMDFDSRDRYRGVIEELARAVDRTESEVAGAALRLARRSASGQGDQPSRGIWRTRARATHVGFYLVGRGRDELEEAIDFRPGPLEWLRRWLFAHPLGIYLGGIAAVGALVLAGAVAYAQAAGGQTLALVVVALFSLLPALIVGVNLVNAVITRRVPPRVLPKLDFSDGVPQDCRTMVVVPALLSSEDEVDFLLCQIELHYLGNTDDAFGFALLTDFADAPEKHMPEDEHLLERAKAGIRRLNREHGNDGARSPFYLFHRERLWNPSEQKWMGWERKRGKLVEFNRLLRGDEETSYVETLGDLDFLPPVEYVITLDADTLFPLDSGHRLVGTLAHPLNRAEFDADGERVIAGYTVLQPRTEVKPTAVTQTRFSRIFAGDVGLDLYTRAVSDVYQDFFGEGIYIGKGIYDVDAFERSLNSRVPENALLSHDLFEAIHGRAALVTDVVLFEDYPPSYLSYARRKHRWVRGDWQLLPWLFPRVPHAGEGTIPNRLSLLDRWKIFDNLRRSLRAPVFFAFLIAGWLIFPGSPLVWTLFGLAISGLPLVTGAVTQIARRVRGRTEGGSGPRLDLELARWLVSLTFLPYESLLMIDAIAATLVRLFVTRRRLLQWTTAAHTVRLFGRQSRIRTLWRQMSGAPALGILALIAVALLRPRALPIATPLLLAWILSPPISGWISQPVEEERSALSEVERQRLRCLARRTWLYFERFVGPEDHWLPPDHFQEDPRGTVARRTSPTNVGLMFISMLSAYDMGYLGLMELMLRTTDGFSSLDELERYRGHFLNWYSTRDLSPLTPRYVSTVDSGNLAACLIALRQGLAELERRPLLRLRRWRGLCDTIAVLEEVVTRLEKRDAVAREARAVRSHAAELRQQVAEAEKGIGHWVPLLADLEERVGEAFNQRLQALLDAGAGVLDTSTLRDLRLWSGRIRMHLHDLREEIERVMPWLVVMARAPAVLSGRLEAESEIGQDVVRRLSSSQPWRALEEMLSTAPRLDQTPDICRSARTELDDLGQRLEDALDGLDRADHAHLLNALERAQDWCADLDDALESARIAAGSIRIGLNHLTEQTERYVDEMSFAFLYDPQRDVFYIGYHVDTERLDENHYDLLASEARIASIVAIGKGDVLQRHWLHLNRPLAGVDGARVLLSWGGSMFEYLMPHLVMRNYEETLLDRSNRAAVERQIAYGREKHVPWGVSESGYYRLDAQMNYQYRGFGVPGLGRKRGLADDLVIAPYATLLAVGVMPRAVLENVDRLIEEGMLGRYGFYEAVDYTESRLPMGETEAVVRSYMAHHQGMSLTALANYLNSEGIPDRFHRSPQIQSVEFLLQEQAPHRAPLEETPDETMAVERSERERIPLEPWSVPTDAPMPQVQFLSNGRYGLLITEAGAGYSIYTPNPEGGGETTALTRWRADTTLDCWGTWIYVQDLDDGPLWSVAKQPTGAVPDEERVRFYPHQVEFRRRYGNISLHTEIVVAPEDAVEIRRLTVTNHNGAARRLRISSYAEVVLATQDQDRRHPAFNKMAIQSEYQGAANALLFTRRPRSAEEEPLHLAHALVTSAEMAPSRLYEADRARFIGRGRTVRAPAAFQDVGHGEADEVWLSGTTGATLDPIMAVGQVVEIEPHATVRLVYLTLVAESQKRVLKLAKRYQAWPRIDRAFDQARTQSEIELRNLDLKVADVRDMQRLLSVLIYPHRALRADPATLADNRRGQSALWAYDVSGDYPVLLVRVAEEEELPLVRELLRAHAYWRDRQLQIDLVILNQRDTGYAQELNDQLNQLITQMDSAMWLNRRGGIFLLRADQMDEPGRTLLHTAARVVLDADQGGLTEQLRGLIQRPSRLPVFWPSGVTGQPEELAPISRPDDLQFDNGYGGFSADGAEYVVYLSAGSQGRGDRQWTPAPWINVVANASFGFLVSDTGLGYSWAGNSGENRLTPWANDPVSNPPAEAVYLRDEETGSIWSPTPLPAGEDAPYLVRHGAGYSTFEHHSHGLIQRLRVFVAPDAPVKVVRLRLENAESRPRRLTVTFFAQWVLGINRDQAQQYVIPEYDPETTALLARNPYTPEFGASEGDEAAVAFVAASEEPHGLTADRAEFLGRHGTMAHPAALDRVGLGSQVAPGLDPCAAVQVHVDLAPHETKEFFFLLGQGENREAALAMVRRFRDEEAVATAWEETRTLWEHLLTTVTVDTPDPAMDLLLNRWLLYQALACRVWGRSALYQSGGAFGFRDQLQDVMSLLHAAPELAREHILRSARHQFEAGDVLHWWHPPSGRGVRTRISDDLLWLPYVTAEYVETTGDEAFLHVEVPFRRADPLEEGEHERYGHYELTEETASIYEHCLRAIEEGSTSGRHGWPLIGAGDWNDGLNRVGIGGEGESIWLGWFLYATLTRFARLCERMDEPERAEALRQRAQSLQEALSQEAAWDGEWYIRATYDDGTPLGASENEECQIASMAQSWAALSGAGDEERVEQAMISLADRLVRREEESSMGLMLLFTPPFDETPKDPGYIKAYPPGIRENGGQYTHAALWAIWAYAKMGQGDRAGALFRLLNPIYHSDTPEKAERYHVEPYVVAADVYSAERYLGRGGWTWYTGSSGWMYRLGVEAILGLCREDERLWIEPCIPGDWSGYRMTYQYGETTYRIEVENPNGVNRGIEAVTLDDQDVTGDGIPLVDDGKPHAVRIVMG